MKTIILIVKLLGCLAALAAAVFGVYWLCGFLPQNTYTDFIYSIIYYMLNLIIPALLALGHSLLIYAVLKNTPKRMIIALLNGVGMIALFVGALLLFPFELLLYMMVAPAIFMLSIILSLIFLALRPKSLPQAEAVTEAAEENQ